MKSFSASGELSSGILAAALVLAVPTPAMAAKSSPQPLETDTPQVQTTIQEWHWRDMAF